MKLDRIWEDVKGEREYKKRNLDEVRGIMIHRVGKDLVTGADFGDTAEEICSAFTGRVTGAAEATGFKVPYTFIVEAGGRLAQTLPLSWIGPHGFKVSRQYCSVAFIGDFRSEPPTNEAFVCGTFLVRLLLGTFGLGIAAVEGHTDVEGATANPNKSCPGDSFGLYEFRSALTNGLAL